MEIEVTNLWLQNEQKRIVAKVSFNDEVNTPHNGATVEVFIPMEGTLEEVKLAAINRAKEFLKEALAPDATIIL